MAGQLSLFGSSIASTVDDPAGPVFRAAAGVVPPAQTHSGLPGHDFVRAEVGIDMARTRQPALQAQEG